MFIYHEGSKNIYMIFISRQNATWLTQIIASAPGTMHV